MSDDLDWAVSRWQAEVANRPLQNVHRRTLDTTWRQVIRRLGGDPDALVGPSSDAMSEWQPIKTAPKDGCDLIILSRNGIRVAHWKEYTDDWSFFTGWYIALDATPSSGGMFAQDATHWMPLPEPLRAADAMSDKCDFCFGTGRYNGVFGHNDPRCPNCNGTGLRADAMSDDNKEDGALRWCSCKASARNGQHMAWCPAVADAMSEVVIDFDSLGYYWKHPGTGQWFGPYNITRERLLRAIGMEPGHEYPQIDIRNNSDKCRF
jgi:hypothetical protein